MQSNQNFNVKKLKKKRALFNKIQNKRYKKFLDLFSSGESILKNLMFLIFRMKNMRKQIFVDNKRCRQKRTILVKKLVNIFFSKD